MTTRPADEPLRWTVASRAVVEQVRATLGFAWVAVTRKRGEDLVLLQVHDATGRAVPGSTLRWADTLCARALDGRTARITPDATAVPAAQEAAALLGLQVGASVSVPLRGDGGELLGTICAVSPTPCDEGLLLSGPVLEAFAGVLGALLAAELRLQPGVRRQEDGGGAGQDDQLTGLGNRQAWERRLAAEERRCLAYGLEAGLLAVSVVGLRALNETDGHAAGDRQLRRTAVALREAVGEQAVLARVGGDQFAVLLPEVDADRLEDVTRVVRRALATAGVSAAVGACGRGAAGAADAWRVAVSRTRLDTAPVLPPLPPLAAGSPAAPPEAGQTMVTELLELARRQLGATIAFVGQWEDGVRTVRGVSSVVPVAIAPGHRERLDATLCQRIVDGRLPRVMPDTADFPLALELPVTRAARIGSYVGVPVTLSDGSLYGTLCCLSRTPDPALSERDADFLDAIAQSMARVLEVELRAAAAHAELVARLDPLLRGERTSMVFQPVVSLVDRSVVGAEALARFSGDPRPVDAWFRDAERAGLTCALELATARAALTAAADLPGFLAINLSATTVCSPGFPALLAGADPGRLVLEISEHEQIADYAAVLAVLEPLRVQGLRLAVDDAGAGFASLRHVVQLRPDIIKLDISLVRGIDTDPTRQALAGALTTFARETGAQVVAEGVETEAQRDVLRAAGVGLMQGWLESGGVSPEQFTARWGLRGAVPQPRTAAETARHAGC